MTPLYLRIFLQSRFRSLEQKIEETALLHECEKYCVSEVEIGFSAMCPDEPIVLPDENQNLAIDDELSTFIDRLEKKLTTIVTNV